MKTVKNLTVANIRNYEGFERREDLDFHDDGNNFRGFSYKGMPITTLRSNDATYLSIRVDYLKNEFTYKMWMATEEYKLCNEFNGVAEIDLDKLVENLEKVISKVNEMNNSLRDEKIDTTKIEERIKYEIEVNENFLDNFKKTFKWYDVNDYTLKHVADYVKSLQRCVDRAKTLDFATMSGRDVRWYNERLNNCGYVYIQDNTFYVEQLKKFLDTQQ